MKHSTTDPGAREAGSSRGLRDLADYLDRQPRRPIPVPTARRDPSPCTPARADDGGRAQVDRIARLSSASPSANETATGGHYSAARTFGVLRYQITAIPALAMATHRALWSYRGSVAPGPVPDTWT